MNCDLPTPGLKRRRRKNGPDKLYWIARRDLVGAGYEPRTVPLSYRLDDPAHAPLISAACLKLQAEMLAWGACQREAQRPFDGTVRDLSRRFQTDPESPFNRTWKWKTREKEVYTLRKIERAFGDRSLAALSLTDIFRWYDAAKSPKAPGKPERLNKAYRIVKTLRAMVAYGVAAELAQCERLHTILSTTRFQQPKARGERLELKHIQWFVPKAIAIGRLSLALGTAIQFETTLRQGDVIGEWEPIGPNEQPTGITLNGRRWVNGLTWGDVDEELVLRKATTKSRHKIEVCHDLKSCPQVFELLQRIPADQRVGPIIVDELAGRPYAASAYGREWRKVARAAGIPDRIWNMDARAGGVSEGDEAGATIELIQAQTGHTQVRTLQRYVRSDRLSKSRRAAELRSAYRARRNEG